MSDDEGWQIARGPGRNGDGDVNGLLDFPARYDIEFNSDGDVADTGLDGA